MNGDRSTAMGHADEDTLLDQLLERTNNSVLVFVEGRWSMTPNWRTSSSSTRRAPGVDTVMHDRASLGTARPRTPSPTSNTDPNALDHAPRKHRSLTDMALARCGSSQIVTAHDCPATTSVAAGVRAWPWCGVRRGGCRLPGR